MFWRDKSLDERQSISRADLQSAITQAVKQSDRKCKDFVDVIVGYSSPDSRLDGNWAITGVKFGRSDRQKAAQALAVIVPRMQHEFTLSETP
jgi:hypothetical protein